LQAAFDLKHTQLSATSANNELKAGNNDEMQEDVDLLQAALITFPSHSAPKTTGSFLHQHRD
jgi:hypothetical protein